MLVVIATDSSARSENVEAEIRQFLATRRPVCLVNVGGALATARWRELVRGPEPIPEPSEALGQGSPSPEVVKRVLSASRFTRAKIRIRVLALSALGLLLLAVAALAFFGHRADVERQAAERAKAAADESTRRAELEDQRARAASERADAASAEAARAAARLRDSEAARERAELARQEALGEAKRQGKVAASRRGANDALTALTFDPLESIRIALKAVEHEPTAEAHGALRLALAAPQPWRVIPGRYRDFDFGSDSLLAVTLENAVEIWGLQAGEHLRTLDAKNVVSAEWNEDGTQIVTASAEGDVSVWDAATGARVAQFSYPANSVRHVSFHPEEGTLLLGLADGTVRGRRLGEEEDRTFLTLDKGVARVWFHAGQLTVWTKGTAEGDVGYQRVIWVAGRGRDLTLYASRPEIYFRAPRRPSGPWTCVEDECSKPEDGSQSIRLPGSHLAITSDAAFAMTATADTATVWQGWNRRQLIDLKGHETPVVGAAFSRDGTMVGTLTQEGVLRLWPFQYRMLVPGRGRPTLKEVVSMSLSSDGRLLATGDVFGDILLWDMSSGKSYDLSDNFLQPERSRVTFNTTDDHLLISTERGKALVLDLHDGHTVASHSFGAGFVARFAKNHGIAVAALPGGGATVWTPSSGETRRVGSSVKYCDLAVSPDGTHVLTTSAGAIEVHRASDWAVIARLERPPAECAAVELDESAGDTAVIWTSREVLIWRWKRDKTAMVLPTNGLPVVSCTVDTRSQLVTVATRSDVRLYQLSDGALMQRMEDFGRENKAVALGPSSHVVVTSQAAMGAGMYLYVRNCNVCVPTEKLAATARSALTQIDRELSRAGLKSRR